MYAVTGTEAAEIAIQLARVASGNIPLISLTNSYHGSYGTAMAASGGSACRHDLPEVGGVFHLQAPIYHWKSRIDDLLEMAETTIKSSTSGKISGFIFETLQGYGGIHVLPNEYINRMAALTRKYGGYVIADEIQTGFGRMGSAYWAYQMSGVEPDIVIIAKGLGCGHPISAIVAKESVFARFNATGAPACCDVASKHCRLTLRFAGKFIFSTYGANPMSAAAACAVRLHWQPPRRSVT
jgi:4-aminobutyrate aminotransferase-like enzyme